MMFCHNCGSPREVQNQNYCPACGVKTISEPSSSPFDSKSKDAALHKFLCAATGIVFLAEPHEPFYSKSEPYICISSLEDVLEEDEELEDQNCHKCRQPFADDHIWLLENGTEIYGLVCLGCIRELLADREVFATEMSPFQYQDWEEPTPRPSAVSYVRFCWQAISYVNGSTPEIASCWNCGSTGTKLNLAVSHWELTLSKDSPDARIVPICDLCADNCTLLIPTPEIAELLT